jgi:metal-sulfur cluster biosynthetic enzyme
MGQEELDALTALIVQALKSVYDPEIPADIYELGLIYNVDIDDARMVTIEMTLTAPACPVAGEMPDLGRERRRHGAGRVRRQGQHGVRSAVGSEPHVRRSARRSRHVVSDAAPCAEISRRRAH